MKNRMYVNEMYAIYGKKRASQFFHFNAIGDEVDP